MTSILPALSTDGNDTPTVPRINLELVTPERAADLLSRSPRNRQLQKPWRAELAQLMRDGKFRNTADTVKISWHGDLLDGQHRLGAIVDAGGPQWLWIAYGVDPEAQDYMDRGRRRTVGNVLSIHGYAQADILAAATKWVVAVENNRIASKNEHQVSYSITPEETLLALQERPGIIKSLCVKEWTKTAPFRCSPSLFIATHYLASCAAGREAADEFFQLVFTGVGLEDKTGPYTLREHLIKDTGQLRRTPAVVQAHYVALAWNSWVAGKQVKQLKYYPERPFPGFNSFPRPR